ncbi:type II toxin-antitoxin system Phd/YefM family antitoxin [Brevibacterium moorei]|uniref:type II toxin-antitoxin system Phd/YefM family antitoxin n=1 Tax=Brevibacterium moorei TaxID=2968457 RepID=UPI00211BEF0C|nr:type II toxin-antitoxin system Phd/YefM family antitoxin [Brevibacterium sp. 68QC2CO]MCQ9385477.1 type II toxin-antitoxin system Phd/YefM family antitoxin [Brevibacterium sp. 68QC2CO]
MNTISVGELRQNPTRMLEAVEEGATYDITRHDRVVGRIVPATDALPFVPPKRTGPAKTRSIRPVKLKTAADIDALIEDAKGQW